MFDAFDYFWIFLVCALLTGPGTVANEGVPKKTDLQCSAACLNSLLRWSLLIVLCNNAILLGACHVQRSNRVYPLPSGKHTKSYGKWQFIVDLPIENGDFP